MLLENLEKNLLTLSPIPTETISMCSALFISFLNKSN